MTKSDRLELANFFTSKAQVLILVMVIWSLLSSDIPDWLNFAFVLGFFYAGYCVVDLTLMEAEDIKRDRIIGEMIAYNQAMGFYDMPNPYATPAPEPSSGSSDTAPQT